MQDQVLKEKIIERINKIEDVNILKSIEFFFNSSEEEIAKFLTLSIEQYKNTVEDETRDYTDYIKEWVKNM
jgi:DNA-directed RNA polymerase specialized sigma subunit